MKYACGEYMIMIALSLSRSGACNP